MILLRDLNVFVPILAFFRNHVNIHLLYRFIILLSPNLTWGQYFLYLCLGHLIIMSFILCWGRWSHRLFRYFVTPEHSKLSCKLNSQGGPLHGFQLIQNFLVHWKITIFYWGVVLKGILLDRILNWGYLRVYRALNLVDTNKVVIQLSFSILLFLIFILLFSIYSFRGFIVGDCLFNLCGSNED